MPTKPKHRKPASGKHPGGRPTKKSPVAEGRILELARSGLPLCFAAASAGIGYQTLVSWRQRDPKFSEAVEMARMASVQARWDLIQEAAKDKEDRPGDWKAAAWSLERTFPSNFGRPEIQLGVAIQTNVNAAATANFEAVVLSDLQFSELQKNPNYRHHPHERPVRDIDGEVVSSGLSGVLTVQNHPGCSVISETQARETQRRVEQASVKVKELFEHHKGIGNGEEPAPANVPTEMKLPPIAMPAGSEASPAWWSQFVSGSGDRLVTKEVAIFVVRTVMRKLLGSRYHETSALDFEGDTVRIGDVLGTLEELSEGPTGQRTLFKLAGRE
jgi:hypothetical protein